MSQPILANNTQDAFSAREILFNILLARPARAFFLQNFRRVAGESPQNFHWLKSVRSKNSAS
jgi:hypothetical protein